MYNKNHPNKRKQPTIYVIGIPNIIKNGIEPRQLICNTILLLNRDITGIDTIAIPKLIHPAQIVAN